jgi:hypothetical protein
MIRTRLSVFAVSALLCLAGAVPGNKEEGTTLKAIAGYRQWTRVTAKPIAVMNSVSTGG